MIVTVTPSPAVDWTVSADSFELDVVNRANPSTREASGKGVNVSWALHRAGVPTVAVFPGGGQTGQFMENALTGAGMQFTRVDTDQEVRTNITLVTPGHSTKINEPGVALTDDQLRQLTDESVTATRQARAVLVCGSLPPTMTPADLAQLVTELRRASPAGTEVVVDSSGEPLTAALASRPSLIKPNVHELSELVRRDIGTVGEVVEAAHQVRQDGAEAVLASLGADGALYVDGDHTLHATGRDIPFVNSVGAGDALLAGFMAVEGAPATRLHNAVLWASSAVAHASTLFPVRPDFSDRITVTDLDTTPTARDVVLTEPSVPLVPTTDTTNTTTPNT
ncbi:1-phosphofructokinase family hexose kinase [Corynebacterium sp. AOP40-9SA-29]|uniref:1-phosphofructokinase family hexose kinase n=1 Tax=Corynebacterium sp. AOP40-9SA-29 TaxID=3457677 RepID=UPI0040339470